MTMIAINLQPVDEDVRSKPETALVVPTDKATLAKVHKAYPEAYAEYTDAENSLYWTLWHPAFTASKEASHPHRKIVFLYLSGGVSENFAPIDVANEFITSFGQILHYFIPKRDNLRLLVELPPKITLTTRIDTDATVRDAFAAFIRLINMIYVKSGRTMKATLEV